MQRFLALSTVFLLSTAGAQAQSLPLSVKALGADNTQSIAIAATGTWYQFGQAPRPGEAWPAFTLSRYNAEIDYEVGAARVQLTRSQNIEVGRLRPSPTPQLVDQYVAGSTAWNRTVPSAPGAASTVQSQQAAVEERIAEIWATPQGFLRAAQRNGAATKAVAGSTEVSFTVAGKYRYEGILNSRYEVERVRTWIANPVLGDTLVETQFSDYKNYSGLPFPGHIVRTQGGYPVLDIQVTSVQWNPALNIRVPPEAGKAAAVSVTSNTLAPGVYYLTGGTHHSVAIEQRDHIVVVEAPLNEQRSLAVIAKVKELIPNKPIKYLVNTHAHFDHAGGLRTYVAEGAVIVTPKLNQAFYQQAWAASRSLEPDVLAASKKDAHFETFNGKYVLNDGQRTLELHEIAGSGHNDAFALVYLPAEKILIEADAYTPSDAPPPAAPNPYTVNLYDNIQKLKLDVTQIAALHGPRVTDLAELRKSIRLE